MKSNFVLSACPDKDEYLDKEQSNKNSTNESLHDAIKKILNKIRAIGTLKALRSECNYLCYACNANFDK